MKNIFFLTALVISFFIGYGVALFGEIKREPDRQLERSAYLLMNYIDILGMLRDESLEVAKYRLEGSLIRTVNEIGVNVEKKPEKYISMIGMEESSDSESFVNQVVKSAFVLFPDLLKIEDGISKRNLNYEDTKGILFLNGLEQEVK